MEEKKDAEDYLKWDLGPNYTIQNYIGYGSFGTVVSGIDNRTKKIVAIKKISNIFSSQQEIKQILREIILLHAIKHPYIVKLIDIIQDFMGSPNVYLVMEYMPMDLITIFESNENMTSAQIKKIMYSLISALSYLHSAGIIHRDVKPGNILINKNYEIRLCDFDLAKPIHNIIGDRPKLIQESDEIKEFNQQLKEIALARTNLEDNFNYEKDQFDILDEDQIEVTPYARNEEIISSDILESSGPKIKGFPSNNNQKLGLNINKKPHLEKIESDKENLNEIKKELVFNSRSKISEYLIETKKERSQLNRKLSHHVVTRWYRPPEIIFSEQEYDYSVDIWSAGCIFGELLKMKAECGLSSTERLPLFLGNYCFPFSPATPQIMQTLGPQKVKEEDQISKIMSVLGTPSVESSSFISSENALNYIKLYPIMTKKPWDSVIPKITNDESSLLSQMLEYNPFFRATAEECLKHSYFSDVFDCFPFCPSNKKINLPFEFEEESSIDKLTDILWTEVLSFREQNNKYN